MKFKYETRRLSLKLLKPSAKYARQALDFYNRNRAVFERYEALRPKDFYTEGYQKAMLEHDYNGITWQSTANVSGFGYSPKTIRHASSVQSAFMILSSQFMGDVKPATNLMNGTGTGVLPKKRWNLGSPSCFMKWGFTALRHMP